MKSANLTNYLSPQICGFAICGTYFGPPRATALAVQEDASCKSAKCCVFLGLNCVWIKSGYLGCYIRGGDLTHRDKYFNFPFLIKLIIGPGGVVYKGVNVCTVKLKAMCEG